MGCRKSLTSAYDSNQAPETWITAAPQDTITTRDASGKTTAPAPGTIPVRFHVYWAGSDKDGAVTGFYYAVVETLPLSPLGTPPELPGPKPRDYHYTVHTDSTFVFTVSEQRPDRQHAFFIYAVDNQGKPDPTPARFIFNALDRYPPALYIDLSQAEGDVWEKTAGGSLIQRHRVYAITDTFNVGTVVKDTVPANSVLSFRWHGEPTLPGTWVTGYRYKLDETAFNVVDSSVHVATYNTGVSDRIAPGPKQFTVRAVDQAGGARQSNRRFQMNMSPVTWFAGPDVTLYPYTRAGNDTYVDVNWSAIPNLTGSLMSHDSITVMPALRPEIRKFFEIYKNRIYVRSENDTVNMNSWVVLMSGGLDPDSPYSIRVSASDPGLPDTTGLVPGAAVVLHQAPPNGSPVGFRSQVITKLTPVGSTSEPSPTFVYPLFDPTDVKRLPFINAYWPMFLAGKAYAITRSEDGNGNLVGGLDQAITRLVDLADEVDGGGGTAAEVELRRRILTFYIDKAPGLRYSSTFVAPGFKPSPKPPYTVYPSRTLDINLPAEDSDPYDLASKPSRVGGPSTTTVLQWWVKFRGQSASGRDTVFAPDFLNPMSTQAQSGIVLPSYIVSTTVFVDIRLCDCVNCQAEIQPAVTGAGRCVDYSFPITVPPPPSPAGATSVNPIDRPGPGSSQEVRRSEAP